MSPPIPLPVASIRLGEPVPADAMHAIERTMQLRHFKWDTQVGDTSVLSSQPLLMARGTWNWLSTKAEHAVRELYALEQTVAADRALQRLVGVPRALRKLLGPGTSANGLRALRFDFHPTPTGWLLSEVNADVPGGFGEASALPILFQPFQKQAVAPPCPLTAWGDAVSAGIAPGHAAMLHAPGYLEDQQVVLTLSRELGRRGFTPHLIQTPAALRWRNGGAYLRGETAVRLHLIVRFSFHINVFGVPNFSSVVEVVPIMRALERETNTLEGLALPPSAPPAFLLDANRRRSASRSGAGWYDNRSAVRESDVPTAAFLKERGIRQVTLVQAEPSLQSDLRAVLRAWQEGGLTVSRQMLIEPWNPQLFTVPKPSLLRAWWDKLWRHIGYPLNDRGSFGELVHGSVG